ncbi:MAG: hypothetical protein K9K37_05045 [Desulfocapsa sp.]|nr:hypothetical protein [Desulfocapsa sp.]
MLPSFTTLTLLVSVLISWLLSGCAQQHFVMPEGFTPLGPVAITFETFTPDPAIETLLSKKLTHPEGPFLINEQGNNAEELHIFYKRQPDIKSIGLILFFGGFGPVEANYTYILDVQHYSGETLLQDFHYQEQVRENTYSVFSDIFNPLYDPQGRSKEIFTLLCHRLLKDVVTRSSGQKKTE